MISPGRITTVLMNAAALAIMSFIPASPALAGPFFTAEVRETYEDNVAGLLADNPNVGAVQDNTAPVDDRGGRGSRGRGGGGLDDNPVVTPSPTGAGAPRQGDFATELYASIGASVPVALDTAVIVQASARHTAYFSFDQFDFTIIGASAGVRRRFSEIISVRASVNGKAKDYDNPLRDSTAYGAVLSLSEQFGRFFWLRQFYEYEKNNADSSLYSYTGTQWASGGIRSKRNAFVQRGYSYLRREYESPPRSA
jgi:hypothetical protein